MRCNIFKPISNSTGEFLMFSQYTDDLTKAMAAGGSYRVIPSRFAALKLNLQNFIDYVKTHESDPDITEVKANMYISQYIQSYYENMVCTTKETLKGGWDNPVDEEPKDGYATQLLWKTLFDLGFIHEESVSVGSESNPETISVFPELQFVGDINIHSDRIADGMNYNDIYCYISPGDDAKYYKLNDMGVFKDEDNQSYQNISLLDENVILGWTQASYPINNGGVDCRPRTDNGVYNISGYKIPEIQNPVQIFDRYSSQEENTCFIFNCVLVFYDVYNDLDSESETPLHYNRPAGIYFTGPAYMILDQEDLEVLDSDEYQPFRNQVTKYVSNDDIFGQGTGWSVRLMTRVVSTPNATSYTMTVDGGDDYSTVAGAMGQIASTIADIQTDMRLQAENYQLMKDHLAIFKNYRTNIPYTRSVNVPNEGPVDFWFVNGRNTGQRVRE